MSYVYRWLNSPVGRLTLIASDLGLAAILWPDDHRPFRHLQPLVESPDHPILIETERQLRDYFDRQRQSFSVPLAFEGTAFQKQVWAALITIPYGETRSYGDIARQIGRPKAVRAVGAANGMNPISIIAPCHRVIGASGALTGFAGGLATKTKLLELENVRIARQMTARPSAQADLWAASPMASATMTRLSASEVP